jgi:hypothetical protein
MKRRFHPTGWLWWTAFYILVFGAGAIYLMYYTAVGPKVITQDMRMVGIASIVGAGICVISATAHWWLRR